MNENARKSPADFFQTRDVVAVRVGDEKMPGLEPVCLDQFKDRRRVQGAARPVLDLAGALEHERHERAHLAHGAKDTRWLRMLGHEDGDVVAGQALACEIAARSAQEAPCNAAERVESKHAGVELSDGTFRLLRTFVGALNGEG